MRPNIFPVLRYAVSVLLPINVHTSLFAANLRLSFLDHPPALEETVRVLTDAGCDKSNVTTFQDLVRRHYATGSGLDLSSLPDLYDGFYKFSSVRALLKALPQRLTDAEHAYDFNCFDTVILLAGNRLRTGLVSDDPSIPFIISTVSNRVESVTMVATARDAFSRLYPPWYQDATESCFPQRTRENRISLTAVLAGWHLLPLSVRNDDLAAKGFAVLRASWRAQDLRFPRDLEVVLYHRMCIATDTICTAHAGLFFRTGADYTYIEKAGGSGPYVRLDFTDKADLLCWLCAKSTEAERNTSRFFATFNDSSIEELIPK
jgi:hypothetical protein